MSLMVPLRLTCVEVKDTAGVLCYSVNNHFEQREVLPMYARNCDLRGKRGIEKLDHAGPFAVIVNRRLYDQGKASKFAVVNEQQAWVDSVYHNYGRARSILRSLNRQA